MPLAQSVEEGKAQVERLVERFDRNLDVYKRPEYKEAHVRAEFIDPLFEALGWDMRNTKGYAEQYKDVVHEDALKVSGAVRAPDYCFRIGGTRKFFLEAKKPSVSVKGDVGPAYQLRRYAWSAKLPLSVLTDFEEFAVYDCQRRPKPGDKASVARILYFTYDQYPDCFEEVYGIFARQSVLEGSFDRYVQDTKGKRGTSEVDTEFLKEIEGWRETLARNLALRNPGLSVHELNYAVQRTIDRIIFLRMAEDRGIEPYGRLMALTSGPHIYTRMAETLYRQADAKYNSGLFDFKADTLTPSLEIDDRVLKPILNGLYYPECPYEFSVLPTEVLGQVYEQFLGKVIRLTPAHRAVVEEKPEIKKAGGVYYTPSYIVDYIVQQTVGVLVEAKSPRQLRGVGDKPPLRVLDPACGSGSFLLGAYQYLLDHYLRWYEENDPEKHARRKEPPVYQGGGGDWRLTTAEKKQILLDHIYGVDIDRQAVEVTKLSLLLKVLEGETGETLAHQQTFLPERALPDLEDNIKCGNSLIGPDYFGGQLILDEEEYRRVNPFDWEREFPEVFASPSPPVPHPKPLSQRDRGSGGVLPSPGGRGAGGEGLGKGNKPLPPALLERARALRRDATDAEQFLWSLLRNRQLAGLKFRRQHPLGGYILDFYCHKARLGIELDGGQHADREQAAYDAQRTRDLEGLGVTVLRFWNSEVLTNPEGVAEAILDAVEGPHPPAPPLPEGEEGRPQVSRPKSGSRLPVQAGEERGLEDGDLPSPKALTAQKAESSPLQQGEGPGVRGSQGEGGFDAVIGNPPYVRQETLTEQKGYFEAGYRVYHGVADLYTYFIERSLKLLKPTGLFGMIISNKWLRAAYGQPMRSFLTTSASVLEIADFAGLPVFAGATVRTLILICSPRSDQTNSVRYLAPVPMEDFRTISSGERIAELAAKRAVELPVANLSPHGWSLSAPETQRLLDRIRRLSVPLETYTGRAFRGVITGLNKAFIIDSVTRDRLLTSDPHSDEILRPIVVGRDVRRYAIDCKDRYLIWTYVGVPIRQYPSVFAHLKRFQGQLEKRWDQGNFWWELRACDYYDLFDQPKLIYPDIAVNCRFALDRDGFFGTNTTYFIPGDNLYLLGILNSSWANFYFAEECAGLEGGGTTYLRFFGQYLKGFPVRTIDFDDPADVARHDRMVALVERMLELHKKLAAATIAADKELYQRQIEATDRQIDALVYELYDLTEDEIAIVEGTGV